MITINTIKKEYANLDIKDLGGGCNVYFPNREFMTIWFKKRKYYNSRTRIWSIFSDKADLFYLLNKFGEKTLEPQQRPIKVVEVKTDGGVKACINHVLNKAKLVGMAKGDTNAVHAMLKNLAVEFEQYL